MWRILDLEGAGMEMTRAQAAPSRAALTGALAIAPLIVGYAPFALVIGSTAATVDNPLAAWSGSWLIYAGSAHLTALHGLAGGSALLAVLTALLVNTRLVLYGASIAPQWEGQPRWFRVLAPALLVDPTWAVADRHADAFTASHEARRLFLGAALTLGVAWSGLIAVGAVAGERLPDVGLELAAPLCLLALIGPRLHDSTQRRAAATAAVVAVATTDLPASTGIVLAIVAGCVAAHREEVRTGCARGS